MSKFGQLTKSRSLLFAKSVVNHFLEQKETVDECTRTRLIEYVRCEGKLNDILNYLFIDDSYYSVLEQLFSYDSEQLDVQNLLYPYFYNSKYPTDVQTMCYYLVITGIFQNRPRWISIGLSYLDGNSSSDFYSSFCIASIIANNRVIFDQFMDSIPLYYNTFAKCVKISAAVYIWNPYYFNSIFSRADNKSTLARNLLIHLFQVCGKNERHFISDQVWKFASRPNFKPDIQYIDRYMSFAKTLVLTFNQNDIIRDRRRLLYQLCNKSTCPIWKQRLVPVFRDHPQFVPWSEKGILDDLEDKRSSNVNPFNVIEHFQPKIKISTEMCFAILQVDVLLHYFFDILTRLDSLNSLVAFINRIMTKFHGTWLSEHLVQFLIENYVVHSSFVYQYRKNHFVSKTDLLEYNDEMATQGYDAIQYGKHFSDKKISNCFWYQRSNFMPVVHSCLYLELSTDIVVLVLSYIVNSFVPEGQLIVEALIRNELIKN